MLLLSSATRIRGTEAPLFDVPNRDTPAIQ